MMERRLNIINMSLAISNYLFVKLENLYIELEKNETLQKCINFPCYGCCAFKFFSSLGYEDLIYIHTHAYITPASKQVNGHMV